MAPSPPSIAPKKLKKPAHEEAGFCCLLPRERRYAELGYLPPNFLGSTVKTQCIGPSLACQPY